MASRPETISRARRADGESTYQALLDAALEIWSAHGIGHVTMESVARRAGRARGTAYHHFADHAALITALRGKLKSRLESLFDVGNIAARDGYWAVTEIVVNSPDVLRSTFTRLLRSTSKEDPVVKMACKHFRDLERIGWLHDGVNPDHAALIAIAMWLAALLAADASPVEDVRRNAASRFAASFQLVMERAILKPAAQR